MPFTREKLDLARDFLAKFTENSPSSIKNLIGFLDYLKILADTPENEFADEVMALQPEFFNRLTITDSMALYLTEITTEENKEALTLTLSAVALQIKLICLSVMQMQLKILELSAEEIKKTGFLLETTSQLFIRLFDNVTGVAQQTETFITQVNSIAKLQTLTVATGEQLRRENNKVFKYATQFPLATILALTKPTDIANYVFFNHFMQFAKTVTTPEEMRQVILSASLAYRKIMTVYQHATTLINTLSLQVKKQSISRSPVDPYRVLILGDSAPAGYGNNIEYPGWIAKVEKGLSEKNPHKKIEIANVSIPGWKLENGLAECKRQLEFFKPDVLIVSLGGNNAYAQDATQTYENNLFALLAAAKAIDQNLTIVVSFGLPDPLPICKGYRESITEIAKFLNGDPFCATAKRYFGHDEIRFTVKEELKSLFISIFYPSSDQERDILAVFIPWKVLTKDNCLDGLHPRDIEPLIAETITIISKMICVLENKAMRDRINQSRAQTTEGPVAGKLTFRKINSVLPNIPPLKLPPAYSNSDGELLGSPRRKHIIYFDPTTPNGLTPTPTPTLTPYETPRKSVIHLPPALEEKENNRKRSYSGF